MKKILLFFLFSLAIIEINAQTIYVSSSTGDDGNSGTSPNSPVKSLAVATSRGNNLLLKKGDSFHSSLILSNKHLGAYGEGSKPVISGYKRIISPNWEKVGHNIWRINLVEDNYSGAISEGSSFLNDIGCIHEYDTDSIHGRKVKEKYELISNWDIWQTNRFDNNTSVKEYDILYLYLEGDPNEYQLEFSTGQRAIRIDQSTVSGIRFEGFGFGLSCGSEVKIEDCEIDAIGGMLQKGNKMFVPYGNGIEFWIANKSIRDCEVNNCLISRCFDSGITIQGTPAIGVRPKNIDIHDNFINNCCQGFECFLRNHDTNSVYYQNCKFRNNIVVASGDSGFGYSDGRFKYCHLLGNDILGNSGMIIENNTFVGGNYYCSGSFEGKYKANVWRGNKCYIKAGDFILSNYSGSNDVLRISDNYSENLFLISLYRKLTGDNTTVFRIKSERAINNRINRLKKRHIKK